MIARVVIALFIAMASFIAYATDPNQLQDFCVATKDPNNGLFVNGFFCKNPSEVTIDDIVYEGFLIPGNTSNIDGSANNTLTASNLPGLNTLGMSLIRFDYAPKGGLVPPHLHHRASEVLILMEGTLLVGFITSSNYKVYTKVLSAGDVFVQPQGLIHFVVNVGKTNAVSLEAFTSQNPGNLRMTNALIGSKPHIDVDILSKAFQLDPKIVEELQTKIYLGTFV